jgi:predicted 3-demethylubiquinone-9 3-methyltransferase (glyoxalase superfamily)
MAAKIRTGNRQKITPFLWFDANAEEAVTFYTSIFKNSKIGNVTRYEKGTPGPEGSVMTVSFELDGQKFVALNGGPAFKFTEAVSFVVNCDSQQEIDFFWKKLSKGGQLLECGWLKDKFGLAWQIVPAILWEWFKDPAKTGRVLQAVMKMKKLDIKKLERAARGT